MDAATQVPEALALALITNAAEESRLFVGPVPPSSAETVPFTYGQPVIGGLLRENGGSLVFQIDGSPEEALAAFGEEIQDHGWELAPEPRGLQGGFVSSSSPVARSWCGENHWLRASSVNYVDSELLRVRYYELEPGRSPCDEARRAELMSMGHYGLVLPTLESPAGARVQMSGGGGSTDSRSMDATIVTDLSAAELFDHYQRQLDRADWEDGLKTIRDGLAIGRWEAQDDRGEAALGILAIWSLPESDSFRAMLRMERVREER